MARAWEPMAEATVVEVLDSFTVRGDGTGSLLIRVDGEERLWELHSHVVKQYLRIRETFKMAVDLDVRVVDHMYVSPEDKTPWVTLNPRFKQET